MIYGPHIDPPLGEIPAALIAGGWCSFQTTLRDPKRLSKEGVPDNRDQEAFLAGACSIPELWGMAHSSMLTSLGSPDPRIRNGSAGALASDANLARALGLAGVCFHVGYEKGHASRTAALDAVVYKLADVVSKLKVGAMVWLENGCEGTELGQTLDEIGYVLRNLGAGPSSVGVVLDTCHLHVSGFDLAASGAPEKLANEIAAAGCIEYMQAIHLNDAREPCGSHRDRHAPPGKGTIGEGLRALATYPMFCGLHGIMEISISEVPDAIAFMNGG